MANNENTHRLTYDGKEIILIGTAHVSRDSVELVSKVINDEKPDTVCIELCQSRFQSMTKKKQWQEMDLIKVIREKKAFLLLSNLILSYFQRKIGQKLGIKPGEEMMQAIKDAEALSAHIHLADRDIRTTLSRMWRLMGFWSKLKLLIQFLGTVAEADKIEQEDVEQLKKRDLLEVVLSEIGEVLPELRRVLIDERDAYLTHRIRTAPGNRIVAVVGAGHIPGIQKSWNEAVDMNALEQIPPKGRLSTFLKWGIPVVVIGIIITGFLNAGASVGAHMIKWWILANAVLAGIGAIIALGHPLTVLSAIFSAPLTSLNPMIAAGWVAGLVEALLKRPKVKDFEDLPGDISSLKGFWRNRITRILLVVVFTNLGSIAGTFVAIPLMAKAFA